MFRRRIERMENKLGVRRSGGGFPWRIPWKSPGGAAEFHARMETLKFYLAAGALGFSSWGSRPWPSFQPGKNFDWRTDPELADSITLLVVLREACEGVGMEPPGTMENLLVLIEDIDGGYMEKFSGRK